MLMLKIKNIKIFILKYFHFKKTFKTHFSPSIISTTRKFNKKTILIKNIIQRLRAANYPTKNPTTGPP